jgi:hypothetical protein
MNATDYEGRFARIEANLEAVTRHLHEFDMSWTGKMGELEAKVQTVTERLDTVARLAAKVDKLVDGMRGPAGNGQEQ